MPGPNHEKTYPNHDPEQLDPRTFFQDPCGPSPVIVLPLHVSLQGWLNLGTRWSSSHDGQKHPLPTPTGIGTVNCI